MSTTSTSTAIAPLARSSETSVHSSHTSSSSFETRKIVYNDSVARWFVGASVVWGLVGMLVGALIALQLAFWQANLPPYLTYGRLRPLHTNAVIFAFVGNMIFAGIYYSTQRLVKARLPSDLLAKVHFWGWQLIIVAAAVTLPLGLTQGKEYAELEWPIDLAIAVVWVVFAIEFFWTLARRTEKHLYVAIWFYIATIITVAVLHIVNSLSIPVTGMKSYSIYGGAKDALVQWWYGHNAVAFFLTTPVLGIMYYFLPKAADRPVYSYRLSVVHFWSLIFVYIWAGPHHLLNTALPDWAQTLGMVFSVMLWAPSWGGMLNGLLTLRGAWGKVRTDPVLKFFAAGVTFYGMATFEGPLLSIKAVNGLAHYTDWIIGHVHSGALGWNGFMAAGMFYWMVPRLYGRELWSKKLADGHFWIGTFGILLYVVAMWVSGITQGMMWRATDAQGALIYPNFAETLDAIRPMYWMRLVGGSMYLIGMLMMAYNLGRTALQGAPVDGETTVVVERQPEVQAPWVEILFGKPVMLVTIVAVSVAAMGVVNNEASILLASFAVVAAVLGTIALRLSLHRARPSWHRMLEGRALYFTSFAAVAVLAGGVAELVPTLLATPSDSAITAQAKPYRALEIEGRDIYVREGCYTCHSQMIRPFTFETRRYGDPSTMADSVYDHPFQWGSKRTGPDLAREGGKYPNLWHYRHLIDPRSVSPGSNMPPFPRMTADLVDFGRTADKMRALRSVGVPYTAQEIARAAIDERTQSEEIVSNLRSDGVTDVDPRAEIVALTAYLQRLGRLPQPALENRDAVSSNERQTDAQ
ncbi:MAG TPA: cytochrome-c oxidase, cbb3-type subunit I [Polyangiaceae bacterium]|nr:cytochrome-c oxidase, cbb3-type subunit I [Polyangiaceae bacterium]